MSPSKCTETLVTRNNETMERMIQAFQNILPSGLRARLKRQDQADQNLPTNTDGKHEAQTVQYCHRNSSYVCTFSKNHFLIKNNVLAVANIEVCVFSLFLLLVLFQEKVQGLLSSPERKNDKTRVGFEIFWRSSYNAQSFKDANQIKARLLFHPFWALYVTACACTCVSQTE